MRARIGDVEFVEGPPERQHMVGVAFVQPPAGRRAWESDSNEPNTWTLCEETAPGSGVFILRARWLRVES